ncbi:alpha/beta fold hydrolase [Brevibacillus sp. TJ4]|uniref:alpha/beta fold hydrolase n=1 Tax=Brevibacillus sp. TJ4 TaxID=3234853 RepID=UPI0037CD0DD8
MGNEADRRVFAQVCRWQRGDLVLEYGEAGSSTAPVLLLLHAIRSTKMLYAGIIPELAKQYRVIAVDLRGHGGSIREAPYSFEQIVDDLAAWLEGMQIERLTVVAASFAAVVAQMLAIRFPEKVSGLILLDGGYYRLREVPGFSVEKTADRLAGTSFSSLAEAERQFSERYGEGGLPAGWMAGELVQAEDGQYRYALPREAFVGYFQAYSTFDKDTLFRGISCPVLLLLADEQYTSPQQRPFLRQAAAAYPEMVKDACVKGIAGAQHLLMVTHPRETIREIHAFAKDLS